MKIEYGPPLLSYAIFPLVPTGRDLPMLWNKQLFLGEHLIACA